MYKLVLIAFLLFGCSSVETALTMGKSTGIIETEANSILREHPDTKPQVDSIKEQLPIIEKREKDLLEELADLKDTSFFRNAIPWIPVGLGVICLVLGYITKHVEDTVAGVVLCISGVVLHEYWSFIGFSGLIIMSMFGVGWLIISHDWKKAKKKFEELTD